MAANRLSTTLVAGLVFTGAFTTTVNAQEKYDKGATNTEIKIGNTIAYSGPGSAYAVAAKVEAAYFAKINAEGGINGRKINFLSYDDAATPPKTVEQIRKLVENDEVLLIFSSAGTASNAAVQKYLNQKKVPQLFVLTGATRFVDPTASPWTMGWTPTYVREGRVYGSYLRRSQPSAKVAILAQNDDYGNDIVKGFKEGLGDKAASMIVAEERYEITEPTMDSHIVKLKSSGADVVVNLSSSKFAAQAIRKIAELGWKPVHIVNQISSSIGATLKPAGLDNSVGIISAAYLKDPTDESWKQDPGIGKMRTFLDQYYPDADPNSVLVAAGYSVAQTLVSVLTRCGDDLTRENVMRQAANIQNLELPMLLPGIRLNTSATNYEPIKQMQLIRFNGNAWARFESVIDGD